MTPTASILAQGSISLMLPPQSKDPIEKQFDLTKLCHPMHPQNQMPLKKRARHRQRRIDVKWPDASNSDSSSTSTANSSPTTPTTPTTPTVPYPSATPKTLDDMFNLAMDARNCFTLFEYPVWNHLNEIMYTANPLVRESEIGLQERVAGVAELVVKCVDCINMDPRPLEAFGCRDRVEDLLEKMLTGLRNMRQVVDAVSSSVEEEGVGTVKTLKKGDIRVEDIPVEGVHDSPTLNVNNVELSSVEPIMDSEGEWIDVGTEVTEGTPALVDDHEWDMFDSTP